MNEKVSLEFVPSDGGANDLESAMAELLQTYRIEVCGAGQLNIRRMPDSTGCKGCIEITPDAKTEIKSIYISEQSEITYHERTGYTPITHVSRPDWVRIKMRYDNFIINYKPKK